METGIGRVWCGVAPCVLDTTLIRGLNKRIGSKRLRRAGNIVSARNLVSKQFSQLFQFSAGQVLCIKFFVMLHVPEL